MITAMISRDEKDIPPATLAGIRAGGIEIRCRNCRTAGELVDFARDADLVWLDGTVPALNADSVSQLPRCRALFRSGSGIDSLPLARAAELGIKVYNTPESISEAVAEHSVALLFALARKIVCFDRLVRDGGWETPKGAVPHHLNGRTLGLVGYGNIARIVERLVSGFQMTVIHHDPQSAASVPLDELLERSDFVSLHCPLTAQTAKLIDRQKLNLMKPDALLINTSRGSVIDEAALIEALEHGRIGGAALDVTECEPPSPDNRLLQLPNVIITPHIAAFSVDFEKNFFESSFRKLLEIRDIISNNNSRRLQNEQTEKGL
jgi:D-3-phosphoglycerate dehydrogenase